MRCTENWINHVWQKVGAVSLQFYIRIWIHENRIILKQTVRPHAWHQKETGDRIPTLQDGGRGGGGKEGERVFLLQIISSTQRIEIVIWQNLKPPENTSVSITRQLTKQVKKGIHDASD